MTFAKRRRRVDPWIAVPLGAMAAVAALDVAIGPEVPLIAVLILGPLLASLRLDERDTAVIAGLAMLIAALLGFPNEFFGETSHVTRAAPVVIAGLLSVWLARLRIARERTALLLTIGASASRILNEAGSLAEASSRILGVIGEALSWELGAVWEVDEEEGRLRLAERWSAAGFDAAAFEAAGERIDYRPGVGIPGRVWESGAPVWLPLLREEEFPRAEAAAEVGLEAAFAFPILAGDRVVGVIEFFGTRYREAEPDQLETLSGLGRQIGQFIERRRAEEQRAALLETEREARLAAEQAEQRTGETAALLDTLIGRAPVGFAYIDTELRYVRVNDELAAMYGREADEVIGRTVPEVIPELPQVAHTLRGVIDREEAVKELEVSGAIRTTPEVNRHWLASYYPVRGVEGRVTGVGAVVVEITERKRAETRATFLAEATAALNASLDYEVTLANIARLTVPHLADWCVVDILEPEMDHLRRLAIAHSDPSKERLLWELDRRYPMDLARDAGAAAAIRTGEAQLYERIDDATLAAATRDEEHLRIVLELGFRSAMAVPLNVRGEPFGAVTFATAESGRCFDTADLALAGELAARAGTAVENARLYRERSHIARTLQESLLPPRLPDMPGIELAARYRAAGEATDVGGDFYDVFPTGERTWGAVVGDFLGKGARAAAMIGLARHTLRTAAMREPDSLSILATLNEALYGEGAEESFCTAVYLAIDVSTEIVEIELTCAGHPLPLVLRRGGTIEKVGRPGTLLGAVPRLSLEPQRFRLEPDDALILFTDGVLEARSDDGVFGEPRLRRLLSDVAGMTADDVADRVASDAIGFQAGSPRDDLAVLVARRHGEPAPESEPEEPPASLAVETDA